MKEQRLQNKSEGDSEILTWVNRSRKLEEKRISEKEKAMQLSRVFEEQVSLFLLWFPLSFSVKGKFILYILFVGQYQSGRDG